MIRVTCQGRVGNIQEELRMTAAGKAVFSFTFAVNDGPKEKQTTTWLKGVLFGKSAEYWYGKIGKGDEVFLDGKLVQNKYQTKDGQERSSLDVWIDRLTIAKKGAYPTVPQGVSPGPTVTGSFPTEEQIPFSDQDVPF